MTQKGFSGIPGGGLIKQGKPNNLKNPHPIKTWANGLNSISSKKMQMANEHVKTCLISLAIRDEQMKSIMSYYFPSTRMSGT